MFIGVWERSLTNDPIFQWLIYKEICSAQSENLDNSGIALRKVRIPKLADRVRILTLRGSILELSVRKVRIATKWESKIRNMFCG